MKLKVFIGWSGALSKEVALLVHRWLPDILHPVQTFVSPKDIKKGADWDDALKTELELTNVGIICLTKENVGKPWIHFEAGALSKSRNQARVCTLLVDCQPSDIEGPLTTLQATAASSRDDMLQLAHGINECLGEMSLGEQQLLRSFGRCWDEFRETLKTAIDKHKPSGERDTSEAAANEPANDDSQRILQELLDNTRRLLAGKSAGSRIDNEQWPMMPKLSKFSSIQSFDIDSWNELMRFSELDSNRDLAALEESAPSYNEGSLSFSISALDDLGKLEKFERLKDTLDGAPDVREYIRERMAEVLGLEVREIRVGIRNANIYGAPPRALYSL